MWFGNVRNIEMQLSQMDFESILRERERRIAEVSRTNLLAAGAIYHDPIKTSPREDSMIFRLLSRLRLRGEARTLSETRPAGV